MVRLAREAGALSVLPLALGSLNGLLLLSGEFAEVASLIEEGDTLTDASGGHLAAYSGLPLAAWRGREAEVSELIEATRKEVVARGGGIGLGIIRWASGVLYNGLGRYEEARTAVERAVAAPVENVYWALSELVEAATRSGHAEEAGNGLEQLSAMTRPGGHNWGQGIEARSRALLAAGTVAEDLYREAIDRLGRTRIRVELARAHLLYGEWLRREHRRVDAREQLRIAHGLFSEFGMEAFAERARVELLATGEAARQRAVETSHQLTAQEAQIARFARDGLSNPEIGSQLFISPRTVQYHLHKVFSKLDISSRNQLDRVLPGETTPAQPV